MAALEVIVNEDVREGLFLTFMLESASLQRLKVQPSSPLEPPAVSNDHRSGGIHYPGDERVDAG